MNKKLYDDFLNAYGEIDSLCIEYFGIEREGITEYINKLGEAKGGMRKAQMLSSLVRYRAIKNEIERKLERGSSKKLGKIRRRDIIRLHGFKSAIANRRDPLSLSLARERASKSGGVLRIALPIFIAVMIAAIVTVLCILLNQ